jgi:hypothetical protein
LHRQKVESIAFNLLLDASERLLQPDGRSLDHAERVREIGMLVDRRCGGGG